MLSLQSYFCLRGEKLWPNLRKLCARCRSLAGMQLHPLLVPILATIAAGLCVLIWRLGLGIYTFRAPTGQRLIKKVKR